MDGGTTWNNNMVAAINECMSTEGIDSQNQISVDVITLMPYALPDFHSDHYHSEHEAYLEKKQSEGGQLGELLPLTMQYYYRNQSIKEYYASIKDIFEFMQANPDVNYRYLFIPQESLLPEYNILEFGIDYTAPLLKWGKAEAKEVIALGPGVSFQQFLDRESSKIDDYQNETSMFLY